MSRFLQCPDCHGIALVIYGEEDAGCGTYDKLHANTTDERVADARKIKSWLETSGRMTLTAQSTPQPRLFSSQ